MRRADGDDLLSTVAGAVLIMGLIATGASIYAAGTVLNGPFDSFGENGFAGIYMVSAISIFISSLAIYAALKGLADVVFLLRMQLVPEEERGKHIHIDEMSGGKKRDALEQFVGDKEGTVGILINDGKEWVCHCRTINKYDARMSDQNCTECRRSREFVLNNKPQPEG
jgi:hypothetical protein